MTAFWLVLMFFGVTMLTYGLLILRRAESGRLQDRPD
jgi:hypothetical protein